MSVTIAPIRAILAILFLFVDWIFCSLIVLGQTRTMDIKNHSQAGEGKYMYIRGEV